MVIFIFCVRITLICVAYKLSENFELEMVSLGKDEKSNQQISLHWQLSTFSLVLCILTCAIVHVAQNEAKALGNLPKQGSLVGRILDSSLTTLICLGWERRNSRAALT